jgi:hypothetical protein
MSLPFGHHVATVTRCAIKETPCESCGHSYFYLLTRSVKVRVSTWDQIRAGADGAIHQGLHLAHIALEKALASDFDAVPCPACGWYQTCMLPLARAKRFGLVSGPALAWLLVGGLTLLAATVLTSASRLSGESFVLDVLICGLAWAVACAGLVAGAVSLIRYFRLRRSYDPNSEPVVVRKELGLLMTLSGDRLDQMKAELQRRDALRQWGR